VAGENLTDADYEYQPGYSMPGINGMIGLQFEL
jgi:iron complex outermembrane receptor protein